MGRDDLHRTLVDHAPMLVLTIRADGVVVYCNDAVGDALGYDPEWLTGQNVLEYLHPEDVERALTGLAWRDEGGAPLPGMTRFRVRHRDGSWVPVDAAAGSITEDEEGPLLGLFAQIVYNMVSLEEVMASLLASKPRQEALMPLCNTIRWNEHGSRLAIAWLERGEFLHVAHDLPEELANGGEGTPWGACREAGASVQGDLADLDPARRRVAGERNLEMFRIEPVSWSDDAPPATVTIWTAGGSRTPDLHVYGMRVACDFAELILRWTEQKRQLEHYAGHDPLTGLSNRRVFFESIANGSAGGAVIYCDLDRFKPVNDDLGHAAGDALLCMVARRIKRCVRDGDMVARLGGDEFAVLCEGATVAEAEVMADRIRGAVLEPFSIEGRPVTVGVSIGVSQADQLDEGVVERADAALRQAKDDGRGEVRVA
jgi:diguanylate cyclase (GGDEF)-like protein/PAS domain S-box-containing protein